MFVLVVLVATQAAATVAVMELAVAMVAAVAMVEVAAGRQIIKATCR